MGTALVDGMRVFMLRPDLTVAGECTRWSRVEVVDRWREPGRWQVTVTDPGDAAQIIDGGILIRDDDRLLMSGAPDGVARTQDSWTISGWDHTVQLARARAWPQPASPVTGQTVVSDRRSGAAETVLLGYLADNLSRLGVPVTVPESSGRGPSRKYEARMDRLLDVAGTLLAGTDLGVRVVWQDRALVVEVWEATTVPGGVFGPEPGTSVDWSADEKWPTVTRVVVGAGGEGAGRVFREYIDTDAEARYRTVAEDFLDQRHVAPDDPDLDVEVGQAAAEALEQGAAQSRLDVLLPLDPVLRYGTDIRVGSTVTVYAGGVPVQDRVTEARIIDGVDGASVELKVGADRPTDAQVFNKRIGVLERSL